MKKNLFYLFALICSMSLFTACSDDDPDYSKVIEEEIAGNYKGTLTVTVEGTTMPSEPQKIKIEKASPSAINLSLANFSFMGIAIGDVELKNCVLSQNGDTYAFTGTQKLEVEALSCTINAKGTIKNGAVKVDMDIDAVAGGVEQSVKVVYEGTRLTGTESSEAKITAFSFDSKLVTEQPVINEENGTITFKVSDTAVDDDLKALVPTITFSEKATVTPASGVAQDFSKGKNVVYTVVAEDGTIKTYAVSISGRAALYSFEKDEWNFELMVEADEKNPLNYWDFSSNGWCTSNGALYLLKALLNAVPADAPYAVTPTEAGYKGGAAEVRSTDSKGMWMLTTVPKVTAGTLFLGKFETDLENTLKSTKFGIKYDEQPVSLKGYYKYQAGETYYKTIVNPDNPMDVSSEIVQGKTDKGLISAVLYEVTGDESLDGTNIYDETKLTAIAKQVCENTAEFKSFEVELQYLKEYDANKKYKFAIICSSSAEGDKFEGAPGSVLTVDELTVKIN